MKTLRTLPTICLLCSLIFVACSKKEPVKEKTRVVECSAEASYDVLAVNPVPVTFDITANTPWEIKCDSPWCSFSPASSAESSLSETVLVRFEDNTTSSVREALMTITGAGLDSPVTIRFVQDVKGELTVTPIEGLFPREGGSKTFTILSNKDWTVSSSASWLTLSPSSGKASSSPVSVTANATPAGIQQQTARITVTAVDAVEYFDVSIEGFNLSFGETEMENIPFMGGTYELPVTADVDYSVQITTADDNVTAEKADGCVRLTVGQNKRFKERDITVTLKPADPQYAVLETSLILHQKQMLAKSSYDNVVINEDGSATFTGVSDKIVQVSLKDGFKYGCFTWNLSEYNLSSGGFTSNTWWHSDGNFMLMIQVSPQEQKLASGGVTQINGKTVGFGFDGGWNNTWNESKNFDPQISDLASIKSIRLLIAPGTRSGTNQNKIIIKKLWVDQTLVVNWTANSGDIWQSGSTIPGIPYSFGVQNASGTLTIDSFEIDTDYQKYLNE